MFLAVARSLFAFFCLQPAAYPRERAKTSGNKRERRNVFGVLTCSRSLALVALLLLAGCATPPQLAPLMEPPAVTQQIAAEPLGDYFIGRRVYEPPFAIWGYVRSPRQPWRTAKLVVLNERYQFAPDRARNQVGSDNGSEYRLYGYFSGDQIYEASSGRFCAEFVLKRSELISANPEPIWSAYFLRDRLMFLGWPRGESQPVLP